MSIRAVVDVRTTDRRPMPYLGSSMIRPRISHLELCSSCIDLEHETVEHEHEHVDDRDRRRSTARPDRPNIPIPMTYRSHTRERPSTRAETVEAEHVERLVESGR